MSNKEGNRDAMPKTSDSEETLAERAYNERKLLDRVDRIEAALGAKMNIDLSEFDGRDVIVARQAVLAQAAAEAAAVIADAIADANEPRSPAERVARIERALGLPA